MLLTYLTLLSHDSFICQIILRLLIKNKTRKNYYESVAMVFDLIWRYVDESYSNKKKMKNMHKIIQIAGNWFLLKIYMTSLSNLIKANIFTVFHFLQYKILFFVIKSRICFKFSKFYVAESEIFSIFYLICIINYM